MNQSPRIIVVEDDPDIRTLLRDYLQRQGFRVDEADGAAACDRLLTQFGPPDLMVLDIMLPGEDGLSICRRLRSTSSVPIVMLTARGDDVDRIVGLEMGADDYLPKPFNPRELVARIRAVLRRSELAAAEPKDRVRVGPFRVDLESRVVRDAEGAEIDLTSAEFDLLVCFIERSNRVLSRDQLMDWTRGRRAEAFDRTIDVQVSRLRKKLSRSEQSIIKTVRNAGYILTASVERDEG
ncbi:MAG: response regulator [Pseudomonadota bacterium]